MTLTFIAISVLIICIGLKLLSKGIELENTRRINDRLNRLEAQHKTLERLYLDLAKK